MDNDTDILIYQTEDGSTKIDVKLENGTVWMTQKAISELYQKGLSTINEHISVFMRRMSCKRELFGKTE